ncbi:MAG: roadblock/LC7 domain-containing protein [Promethearchaeia archaeon]
MNNLQELKIKEILEKFRKRINIFSSTLITEDGFLITVDQDGFNKDFSFHDYIGPVCAGIFSLAENCAEIVYDNSKIMHVYIQAGETLDLNSFNLTIEQITKGIILAVIAPLSIKQGILRFELNQTKQELKKYFEESKKDEMIEGIVS